MQLILTISKLYCFQAPFLSQSMWCKISFKIKGILRTKLIYLQILQRLQLDNAIPPDNLKIYKNFINTIP